MYLASHCVRVCARVCMCASMPVTVATGVYIRLQPIMVLFLSKNNEILLLHTVHCSSIKTDTFFHFKLQNFITKLHHVTDYFDGAMPLQKITGGAVPLLHLCSASPDYVQ